MKSPFLRRFGMPSPFFDNEAGFSPTVLLAGSTAFLWLDPSDLTTLFQDRAGTTPVTAAGQPVGLVLDKSQGLVLGPELVTNGDFSVDANWTKGTGWSISGGAANFTVSAGGNLTQSISVSGGRYYRVNFTVSGTNGSSFFGVRLGGSTNLISYSGVSDGANSVVLLAESVDTLLKFAAGPNGPITLDNISVRELPGFHATQSTAASRPTYGVVPSRGRVNLLTFTEQFDNAAWVKSNCTFSSGVVTTTTNNDGLAQAISNYTSNASHATTWRVSAGTATWLRFVIFQTASSTNRISGWFNVATGTAGSATNGGTGSGSTLSFTQVSAGVYDVTLVGAVNNSATAVTVQVSTATADQSTTGVSGVTYGVQRAQLETGSTASPYQRVVSQFDVTDPVGFPSYPLHYLSFDGVDDFLVTPTITPNADKVQVFAGVRKLGNVDWVLAETSANASTNNGAFAIYGATNAERYGFASRGTIVSAASTTSSVYNAPITNVITGLGDISGDISTLRINGTQVAQSTANQGTGNFLAYPLYIGRRGGTSLPFNGQLYGLITRFSTANLDASVISQTERWMGGKTGVTI